MNVHELRKKDIKELHTSAHDLRGKLSDIRFKSSLSQLKNVKEVSNIKKDIAKILTIIKEKEITK